MPKAVEKLLSAFLFETAASLFSFFTFRFSLKKGPLSIKPQKLDFNHFF
jgi:hypothetical protein